MKTLVCVGIVVGVGLAIKAVLRLHEFYKSVKSM